MQLSKNYYPKEIFSDSINIPEYFFRRFLYFVFLYCFKNLYVAFNLTEHRARQFDGGTELRGLTQLCKPINCIV